MLGKIDSPLNKKLNSVKWGKFRLGDLFEIESTKSFNTDKLVPGNNYDYVTRTSINQGVLQSTGFINNLNLNQSGMWSLGLLQMDFFYRYRPWYAGQYIRRIVPKINISDEYAILFFQTVLNYQKKPLLQVLVRNVNKTFRELKVFLPIDDANNINYEFMKDFIKELEKERINKLNAYLESSGLNNYILTEDEKNAIAKYKKTEFQNFAITEIFSIHNTHNILSSEIIPNSGSMPYLGASAENNSVNTYISYKEELKEKGKCIFIGGKTFVVSYQEKDFYSNDSHNLALYLNNHEVTENNQLFLATCVNKSLSHKYSWGDSISSSKIKKDKINLPVNNNVISYEQMEVFIRAIKKLVIQEIVKYVKSKFLIKE